MEIRGSKWLMALAVVTGLGLASGTAMAAPTANLIGDSGTLVVQTYSPTLQIATASLANPYGYAPAAFPSITPVTGGWKITFTPSSAFFASANNNGGGKTSTFAGDLAFDFSVDTNTAITAHLTVNVFEDGIWSTVGNGRVSVGGSDVPSGIIVTALDPSNEQHGNSFSSAAVKTFNSNGTWTLFDQVTGFTGSYNKYHIVIDNDLLAEALGGINPGGNLPGSASIAKKDFSIVITTDGSSGGGPPAPEPASLGMLALGSLALVARRRRA